MINETIDKDQTASPRLDISAETESYLKTSAKWGFFLAVMGYWHCPFCNINHKE